MGLVLVSFVFRCQIIVINAPSDKNLNVASDPVDEKFIFCRVFVQILLIDFTIIVFLQLKRFFIFFQSEIWNSRTMYLYNLTLQRATGITHAIHGNFSGSKIQEILISHGKSLELVRPDPNTGKVHTLLQTEIFGIIRSMMSFRLTGSTKGKRNQS